MLDLRQAFYYSVYQLCARGRGASMGGPLPIDVLPAIRNYCELFNISNLSERDRLIRYVVTIDNAYLTWVAEQKPAPGK